MCLLTPLSDSLLFFSVGESRPREPTWAGHPQNWPVWFALQTQVLETTFQLDLLLACELGHRQTNFVC